MVNERIKKDDSGFSLVELIAVISIMIVVTGITALSLSMMFSKDAKRAVALIDDELSETRMLSMSKADVITMTIHTSDNGKTNSIEITEGTEGTNSLKTIPIDREVKIRLKGSATADEGEDITIRFDKTNGSVIYVNGPAVANGLYEIEAEANRGKEKTATVTLIANTGRHFTSK